MRCRPWAVWPCPPCHAGNSLLSVSPAVGRARCTVPNARGTRSAGCFGDISRVWAYRLPWIVWGASSTVRRQTTTFTPMPNATPQLRVLVIDDSVDNAEALSAVLTLMGCRTSVAFSGIQGIAAAAGFEPHLAFIDLEMPGMGGCEVVRRLRTGNPRRTARLICLTGRGQPDDRRICLDAGFDDFFTKPMAPESLATVVATASAAL